MQVNTYDIQGGAARAANRLHNALKANGVVSNVLVINKKSSDASVIQVCEKAQDEKIDYQYILRRLVQPYYINSARTELSNTLFSFAYPGYNISTNHLLQSADLINLHWVSFFQSPVTINKILKLGKPVVWTLHDMNPFTGGCHYSAGCDGYTRDCKACPQLSNDPYALPNAILNDKLDLFADFPLTIVTPSRWLADCARKSALFKNCRVEVIPNCLEADVYVPIPKNEAKVALGIDTQKIILMFGADSSNEKRKGFTELAAVLARASANPIIEDIVRRKLITILTLGPITTDMSKLGLDIMTLGHIDDDRLISRAYSAADIFILPSLEDNLPNMMLEAMACGTPVLAFRTGGIPDVVKDGINGCLVPTGDVNALAEKLVELISNKTLRERLGSESAVLVQKEYTQKIQADRYMALFDDLLDSSAYNLGSVVNDPVISSNADELDMECGPNFNFICHRVMLDALLIAIPDLIKANTPVVQPEKLRIIQNLQCELEIFKSSRSWRLTKPLRWLGDLLSRKA